MDEQKRTDKGDLASNLGLLQRCGDVETVSFGTQQAKQAPCHFSAQGWKIVKGDLQTRMKGTRHILSCTGRPAPPRSVYI
jgi:hypothetical protein